MEGVVTKESRSGGYQWSLVFAANLVIPLFFAMSFTRGIAWAGVAVGVGLLWFLGHRLGAMSQEVGRSLVIGGCLVAATQIWPMLQMFAGIVGAGIGSRLGREPSELPSLETAIDGFVATVATGALLIGFAFFCGAILSWLFPRRPSGRPVIGSPLFDRQLDG